jgi:hypothetical protein
MDKYSSSYSLEMILPIKLLHDKQQMDHAVTNKTKSSLLPNQLLIGRITIHLEVKLQTHQRLNIVQMASHTCCFCRHLPTSAFIRVLHLHVNVTHGIHFFDRELATKVG